MRRNPTCRTDRLRTQVRTLHFEQILKNNSLLLHAVVAQCRDFLRIPDTVTVLLKKEQTKVTPRKPSKCEALLSHFTYLRNFSVSLCKHSRRVKVHLMFERRSLLCLSLACPLSFLAISFHSSTFRKRKKKKKHLHKWGGKQNFLISVARECVDASSYVFCASACSFLTFFFSY